jgi:bacterioferritin-associated ferredoxin
VYVCICNALNEGRVREVVANGCETVGDVYRACGTRPQCGKCICAIADIIRSRRGGSESVTLAAD